ncbi:putative dynamin family protein [Rosellinia necatrix]|uniref:Putative dynamin family protein n=1 Tax=Rosellinia necatrix TaxID=77044 RepID=A0A1S7UI54_ROSNE|nr:putative dynamin family protein [Rosellinia necatrix]
MATVSLDPKAIEQLSGERKTLLDTIDSLRKHGVGRFVDLPQIIVVGDQSSGKSSVLEAISRVRFPVKDGLCTRFATELVLRTDPQTRIDVQVQPASLSSDAPYTFNETRFDDKEELPRIIEEAKTRLIRDSATFSEDVLRIEISSPDVPHLTLVDLPGFYHSEDDDQSADGREIVDRLAEMYMARKNSIILAIVSARNQIVMQKVLSKVKAHDKNQVRTLGIVTKPDLLVPGSQDEDKFIKLARNQEQSHQLDLGWHVLRNRSEAETSLSPEARDSKEEEFFASGIWSAIPSNNRGVGTLRKKLSNILLDHIRKNLGTLMKDIQDNLNIRRRTLERMGAPRSSPSQLRAHLDKIASQFQLLSLRAIEGNYSDEFFGGLYPDDPLTSTEDSRIRKLRALVRDLNRTFTYVLATKGSRRVILPDYMENDDDGKDAQHQQASLPSFLRIFENQYPFEEPEKVTREAIKAELEPISSANQGTEFPGTTNDFIAVKLFQDQSRPWEPIARFHIDFLLRIVKSFAEKLITHITGPDQTTCSSILSNIVDPFFEERTELLTHKLKELLYHFQSGYPQPSDAEFRAILTKRHQNRLSTEILQNLVATRPDLFSDKGKRKLGGLGSSGRKSEFGVDSLIDKSETYYELSLQHFTDNVIILAIENCLIKDLPTILTTGAVSQMGNAMLEKLAAESADVQVERTELGVECEALQKGLDLCKTYRSRNSSILPELVLRPKDNSLTIAPAVKAGREGVQSTAQNTQHHAMTGSPASPAITPSFTPPAGIKIVPASTPPGTPAFSMSGLSGGNPSTTTRQPASTTTSLFGRNPNTTAAQQATPTGGLFGSRPSATTEQPASSTPSGFVSSLNTTTGLFGSNPSTTTEPAGSTTSWFGSKSSTTAQPTPAFGSSTFGSQPRVVFDSSKSGNTTSSTFGASYFKDSPNPAPGSSPFSHLASATKKQALSGKPSLFSAGTNQTLGKPSIFGQPTEKPAFGAATNQNLTTGSEVFSNTASETSDKNSTTSSRNAAK